MLLALARLLVWLSTGLLIGLLAGVAGSEATVLVSATAIFCFLLPVLTRFELGRHHMAFATIKLGLLLAISGPVAAFLVWNWLGASIALAAIFLTPYLAAAVWGRRGALRYLAPLIGEDRRRVLARLFPRRHLRETEIDPEWLGFGMEGLQIETFAFERPGERFIEGAVGFEDDRCVCINYFENREVIGSLKWMTRRGPSPPLRRLEPPTAMAALRPDLQEYVLEIYTWPPTRKSNGSQRRYFGLLRNYRRFGRLEDAAWSDAQRAARGPGPRLVESEGSDPSQ